MKNWLIKKLGGYPDINAAIRDSKNQDPEDKHRIFTLAVKQLFNTISEDDILSEGPDGRWLFEGDFLPNEVRKLLQAEAKQLLGTRLWKVLKADIQYKANKSMFEKSRSIEDLIAGKLWLYTLDTIETRLKRMEKNSGLLK